MQPSTNSQFGAGDMVPLDYKMNGDGDKPVSLDQEGPVLLSQMATESSSLLSPVDPKTLPLGQKFKWLFSASTLGRRQNIDEVLASENDDDGGLKKVLSIWDILAYGIAFTVGAGIFVVTGVVAKNQAGPAIIFCFLLAGVASLLSAFAYSEFAARIPVSGSAYSFTYVALGEVVAWLIGWNLTLEYAISGSAVARGWASYVHNFFHVVGVELPFWMDNYMPFEKLVGIFSFSPLALVIVIGCSAVLLLGAKKSAWFNKIITLVNLAVIIFVIALGSTKVNKENWNNFFPFGFQGIFQGAGTIFFSYIGFDSVTTLASESANPKRDLPLGIIVTLGVATALYVAVSLVVTGMVPYDLVNPNSPLSSAFHDVGLPWAAGVVAAGSVTILTASTLASLLSQPRIFMQMSNDGLFFSKFGNVGSTGIPTFGTIITGVFAGVLAAVLDLNSLADMISIGTLMAFTVVCGGVILLRHRDEAETEPEHYARFKCCAPFARIVQPNVIWILCFFCLCVIGFGINYKEDGPVYVLGIFGGLCFLCYLAVQTLRPLSVPSTFKSPLVPLFPMVGMFINIYFITQLPYFAVLRVAVWSVIGMLIYFFYGAWNSRLNHRYLKLNHVE